MSTSSSILRAGNVGVALAVAAMCALSSVALAAPVILVGHDLWVTMPESRTDFAGNPIPADFFEPGSDPFDGIIALQGQPLPGLGGADTIVERFNDGNVPNVGNTAVIDIEIVELSLRSIQPIQVDADFVPTFWDVFVDLSPNAPSPGTLSATKTHENGGNLQSTLQLVPRFTFTKVGDAGEVRVLDFFDIGQATQQGTIGPVDWEFDPTHGQLVIPGLTGPNFYPFSLMVLPDSAPTGFFWELIPPVAAHDIPEPTTLLLLAIGAAPIIIARSRRSHRD